MNGTKDHPLTKWRLAQEPPWPVNFLARRLGTSVPWLSAFTSSTLKGRQRRCSPELAYAIEVLTGGEVTMLDMLLTPDMQQEIKERIYDDAKSH